MARLDQSFIKAYGNVGARASASRSAPANSSPPAALPGGVPMLPLLSAAPIVVDAGAFAGAYDGVKPTDPPVATSVATAKRVEAVAERSPQPSPPSRPHFRRPSPQHLAADADASSPQPPSRRRPPAPSQPREAADAAAPPSTELAPSFDACAFVADTFGAPDQPQRVVQVQPLQAKPMPQRQPNAGPPVAPRAPSRLDPAKLCHRACTVELSTTGGAIDAVDDRADDIEQSRITIGSTTIGNIPPESEQYRSAAQAFRPTISSHRPPAPHVDGVAYRPMSGQPASALRPGYEVDAFRWPPTVAGLAGRATTALASLIDELVDASSSGRGVVMFAGERRGSGTTTLSVYAARRLAELGLSVALVDADFAKPMLARSLGVAVEYGWDDAAEGHEDVAAALIASLDDGLALLPLRRAATTVNGAKAARLAADLAALRRHFALVIVDGGPLAQADAWLAHAPEETVDCGIIVRDVREDEAHRPHGGTTHVRPSAYPAIGVVENFVREMKAPNR